MDISKAAMAPHYGIASVTDRQHPLFPLYDQYRSNMSRLMVDASDFRDWLYQYERNLRNDNAAKDPDYPDFLAWIRETKAGGRKCPGGDVFPRTFHYWLNGGRW